MIKAIEFSLDDILEGFLRQLDLLDWTTTIAKVEGENIYLNAGKLSGLRIGDTLEVFEPGKEILHPTTNLSLGWTTGKLKGSYKSHRPIWCGCSRWTGGSRHRVQFRRCGKVHNKIISSLSPSQTKRSPDLYLFPKDSYFLPEFPAP